MQQAAVANTPSSVGTNRGTLPAGAPSIPFVINLCSSTSPVSLTPPDHAGLKRFTFFVSRRREEGRERFRLHMGYFETQEEAEKLLDIVREIYPGAWAGLAPGQRLRAAAAAAAEAAGAPAASAAAPSVPVSAVPALTEPTVQQPILQLDAQPANQAQAAQLSLAPESLSLVPDLGRRLPDATDAEQSAAANALTNVRAAIASLEDGAERAPLLRTVPVLKPPAAAVRAPLAQPASKSAPVPSLAAPAPAPGSGASTALTQRVLGHSVAKPGAELTDNQTLAMLEGRHTASPARPATAPASGNAAKTAAAPAAGPRVPSSAQQKAPSPETALFAVQLMWSVQPIDISTVPQLAIFSAYTLYGAEGNRDGRRWYGLRLGFFTDAVSAKQVAHYVRSEFSTVSVVPVTSRESERAKLAAARPTSAPVAPKPAVMGVPKTNFEFIEDKQPAPAKPVESKTAGPRAAIGGRLNRGAPGKRAKLRSASQVNAHGKTRPKTLEETLEILGAGQLQMDEGRSATINESGVRHLRLESMKSKPSRLGRLLERLSERLGS